MQEGDDLGICSLGCQPLMRLSVTRVEQSDLIFERYYFYWSPKEPLVNQN